MTITITKPERVTTPLRITPSRLIGESDVWTVDLGAERVGIVRRQYVGEDFANCRARYVWTAHLQDNSLVSYGWSTPEAAAETLRPRHCTVCDAVLPVLNPNGRRDFFPRCSAHAF